jgi:hypothetical protein
VYPLRVSAPQPLTNRAHHTQTQSKPKPRRPQTASGPTRRPSPAAFDPAQLDMQQANTLLQQSLTQLYKSKHEAGDGKVVPPWDPLDVEPRWRHRTNLFDAHAPARSQVSGSRWKIGTGPETLCGLVRAEASVGCRGFGRSAVDQYRNCAELSGSCAENGGHHRATLSPMACVRWPRFCELRPTQRAVTA